MNVRKPMQFDKEIFFNGLTEEQLEWTKHKENHMKCNVCPFKCHTVEWMDIIEACGYDSCIIEYLHKDWWKKDNNGEGN